MLLLIDFQRDFLADDGRMPVARSQVAPVLAAARAALARGLRHRLADAVACRSDVTRARALAKLGHLGAEVAYGDAAALAAPD